MGRILAIDYGAKRTGIAVTDPGKIIASPLDTVATIELVKFLKNYFEREAVDEVVIGLPKKLNNQDSDIADLVRQFIVLFNATFPGMKIVTADERFTSSMAQRALIESGYKKKDRRVKGNVDKVSATLILQSYMESI